MLTCSIGDWTKAKQSYTLDVPAAVNLISMTLIKQPAKEKLLILKTKAHSFHTANISYRHITSQHQFFIIRQTIALG